MFLCRECFDRRMKDAKIKDPLWMPTSVGTCEDCGEPKTCADMERKMRLKIHMVRTPEAKTTVDGEFYGSVLCSSSRGGHGRPLPRIRTNNQEYVTCAACLKKLKGAANGK